MLRHFPTKQDLLEATLRCLERMDAEVRRLADSSDAGSALASVIRLLVDAGPTKVTLLNLLLSEGHGLGDAVLRRVEAVRDVVGHVLERAQRVEAARADVTLDDVLTLSRALAHVAAPDQDQAIERALEIVLEGLHISATGAVSEVARTAT